MTGLVLFHLLENAPAALIRARESLQVLIEMALNLAFGFSHKPQTHSITERTRECADGEGSRIPQGVEHARPAVELAQALLAPGEMIAFFLGSLAQFLAHFILARGQCLSLVQRLRSYLARMIDAHEPSSVAPLGFVEHGVDWLAGGIGARCGRCRTKGLERAIRLDEQQVQSGQWLTWHGLIIYGAGGQAALLVRFPAFCFAKPATLQ